ncbi:MAG TPA: hypothetical protein VHF69_00565 [Candidatus Synoicihabitans sp.]|nr:hypothetical protein [Candidatus Synoicihabitans sp.]
MSLINDALKKAQKMRQQEPAAPAPDAAPPAAAAPAPAAAAAPLPPPARPTPAFSVPPALQRHRRSNRPLVITLLLGTSIALAVLVFLYVSGDQRPAGMAPAPRPVIEPAPVVTSPASASARTEPTPTTAADTSRTNAPVVTAAPEVSFPAATPAVSPPAISPAPVTPAPIVTAPVEPAPVEPVPAGPDPRILDYLERLRITGIRPSATDPKVLMNDRVYRLNDVVDRSLGLRITGIVPGGLTFTDARGETYEKNF